MFADFPYRDSFEFEDVELDQEGNVVENGERHLSLSEINYLVDQLVHYDKMANNLSVETDRSIMTRFLEHMINAGIPLTRKVYYELYRVLDYYGVLSEDVKHMHKTSSSKYCESNYIKSLVSTIMKRKKSEVSPDK